MRTMRLVLLPILAALSLGTTPTLAQLLNYELVPVGDAGNAADTTGFGAVPYEYQIGKYEVTIGQYVAFLNSVGIGYDAAMASVTSSTGIVRDGSFGSYTYRPNGPLGGVQIPQATAANRPIAYVSWFNAARFANWMSNGQPVGAPGPTTTEDGAYPLNGASSGTAPAMNPTNPNTGLPPLYRIPTQNEWYKAAYYKGGGLNTGYWMYATQSDASPGNIIGSALNQANFRLDGNYSLTQASGFSTGQNFLTDVGAFSGSPSAYGTFDQSGNLEEWHDLDGSPNLQRGIRGGNWTGDAGTVSSSYGTESLASSVGGAFTFRLASPAVVPEPATYAIALAGLACGGYLIRRRKRA